MTRQECEQQILEKLKEIAAIARVYNPNIEDLHLSLNFENNTGEFNNSWYKDNSPDKNKPLNFRTNFLISKGSEDKQ